MEQMVKKNVSSKIAKLLKYLPIDLLVGALVGLALILMYVPDLKKNDSLFSEMNSLAKDRDEITRLLKSTPFDPTVLEIAKVFPLRKTEDGIIIVEKGFSQCVSKMPDRSLLIIVLTAVILTIVTTVVLQFVRMLNCSVIQTTQKKNQNIRTGCEVFLFVVILVCLLYPNFKLFHTKGSATALAGFYTAIFIWFFHLKWHPYFLVFGVDREGPLNLQMCKMMSEHYSKLLSFVFAIFTACTIGLAWYISQILAEKSAPVPELLNYQLAFLFVHDIYLSAWLLLGVAKELANNYAKIVSRASVE